MAVHHCKDCPLFGLEDDCPYVEGFIDAANEYGKEYRGSIVKDIDNERDGNRFACIVGRVLIDQGIKLKEQKND